MPTELEELVRFIAHPNPQIRQVAIENLAPFSTSQPSVFKSDSLRPVKHLKLLVRDQPKIAEYAITVLVNLSRDRDVLEDLVSDDKFLDFVLARVVLPSEPNANLLCMLLANLAKWEAFKSILSRKQDLPTGATPLGSDALVINQLVDLFVRGADGSYDSHADYDYLAYLFADLSKHPEARRYFLARQAHDGVIPLAKLKVFTEHASDVRRKGVASTIKNVAFEVDAHAAFFNEDEIHILPYVLLPITGPEEFDDEDAMAMLPELQLLSPEKRRDPDSSIVQTHVETLMLLATTRHGRDVMREVKVYPLIRETHLHSTDDGVKEACERLVSVLIRDEADAGEEAAELAVNQDDNQVVEV